MKAPVRLPRFLSACAACLGLAFVPAVFAAATWIHPTDGFWKDGTNWSSGRAPSSSLGSTLITNANTKTVSINAQTPSTNLTINSLTLSGSATTTNTLLLSDVGTNNPLTLVSSELKIAQGGALILTNSSLVLTGSFSQGFNLFAGNATLESGSVRIIEDPDVTNITVFVRVGRTNAASLTINGGIMEAGTMLLADAPFAQFGAQGTVRITGGLLSLSAELSIGDGARGTGVVEVVGGQLRVANSQTNITRVGDQGVGQMIVSNASAFLGNISVARHDGALGTLTIQENGLVQLTDDLSIGRFSGATGTVLVAGGQLDVVDHPIWAGREGIGRLVVSNGVVQASGLNVAAVATNTASGTVSFLGGSMVLSSNLVIGSESNSIARMSVEGGDIAVTNTAATAEVDLLTGVLTLNGGMMTTDNLRLTNSAGGLVFNGGTLRSKNSVVSNGSTFVVGNGVRAATLELLGGTHSFANGLVISSNATLTGCGTIIGSVTNFGTIATNCGVGNAPSITTQPQTVTVEVGGTAAFSVTASGAPPLSYQWLRNETNLAGRIGTTLTLTNVQPADAGSYAVLVGNGAGFVTSSNALLRVLVSPDIINVGQSPASFGFSFASESGLNYSIEYKNQLNDPVWSPLRTEPGTGNVIPVTDTLGPDPVRFYRIRVE